MTGTTELPREILVVAHARREDTVAAARRVIAALQSAGAHPVLPDGDVELRDALADVGHLETLGKGVAVDDLELAIVLGGTASELLRERLGERHEPGSGEINYPFLFAHLDRIGYRGHVGCEYKPAGDTEAGLGWLAQARGAADVR